ncbi:MAG: adenylate/guanylate cyclase domain-containing protein, partial [Candidatus Wallbacteria bacterium]|nr:adenylate/guanylate cyclase domain-containing protein [Candidatus Wallbacteria bacterium]
MPEVVSKNLSIMLTDIQGYSTISSSASREEILKLISEHSRVLTPIIEFYNGRIVKTIGDAFLCVFESATDAVVCAIIIQIHLKEYNAKEPDKKLNIRIVINTGDVSLKEGDIYGDGVNITARMESLSCFPGGTVGISESTYL